MSNREDSENRLKHPIGGHIKRNPDAMLDGSAYFDDQEDIDKTMQATGVRAKLKKLRETIVGKSTWS